MSAPAAEPVASPSGEVVGCAHASRHHKPKASTARAKSVDRVMAKILPTFMTHHHAISLRGAA